MDRNNSENRISMSALSDTLLIENENEENHERKRYLGIFYVPPKLEMVCSKCCCLSASAVITVFICIVTIAMLIVYKPQDLVCTHLPPPVNYSQVILMANADGCRYLDLNEKKLSKLPSTKKAINLFDVYDADTIYWVDESTWTIRSFPKEYSKIKYPKTWKLTSIAADFVNEKLYLIENTSNSLKVVDVHTKFYRTLATEFEDSSDLVVDPLSGFLFVVKRSNGIFRMNMDGSSSVLIIISKYISAMTIDREAQKIYYANDYLSIASSNYNGETYRLLTKVSVKIASIALHDDTIFWATDESLYSCKVTNGSCDNGNFNTISSVNKTIIRTGSHRNNISNPCERGEAGTCDDMCLLTSNRTTSTVDYICTCRDGWQLKIDGKSCKPLAKDGELTPINYSQVILIAGIDGFHYLDLEEKRLSRHLSTQKAMNLFDVYTEDTIFWVDESTWTIRSFPNEHSKIKYPKTWKLTCIASDFVNEKLYLIETTSKSLKVVDVHTKFYRTLATEFEDSSDLAVDPLSGFLFVVKRSKGIFSINMDGSSIALIVNGKDISAMTIDREAQIVYYTCDYGSIASSNYNGKSYKLLTKVSVKIASIALLDDTIFWSTDEYLYFCKVTNRSCDKDNLNEISLRNATIIRTGSHRNNINNPCERDAASACDGMCLLTSNWTTSTVDYTCSCRDGWQLSMDGKSCEPLPKEIELPNLEQVITLLNEDGYIWFVSGNSKFFKPIKFPGKKDKSRIVFEVYSNDTIFWCEEHTSTIKSLSPAYSDVRYPSGWEPIVLRIDYVTDKMYILDGKTETINCIDMQGRFYGVVSSDIESPSDFMLDPERGLMFIVISNKTISRATMSGRSLRTIVAVTANISSFVIDRESQIIYYALNSLKIESINYNGTRTRTFQISSSKIHSLAILNGRLFWSDNSGISSCKIGQSFCDSKSGHLQASDVESMRFLQSHSNLTNPCKNNNGNCEQLCILDRNKSSLDRTCACKTGWELLKDERTCIPISDFMLYTRGNVIRGRVLNEIRTSFIEAIPPTRFQVESLEFKDTIDFDYNWITHDFIFSDDYNIYVVNVMDNEPQRKLVNVFHNYHIKDVAYDWRTGNLYYVQKSVDNSTDHSLMVLRIHKNERFQKAITSFTHDSNYPMKACPHSLVVHSERGYLFYTAWNGERKDIQRTAADGTGLKEIGEVSYHNKYHIIAIDYEDAKMYWIYDKWKTSKIRYSDMNGNNYKQIEVSQPQYPTSIYVHQNYMYIGNSISIWRYDKLTGLKGVKMTPIIDTTRVIAGVRIVGQFMQASNEAHPCVIDNGGCQQLCFAVPQKKCECKDGQYIFQERFCRN